VDHLVRQQECFALLAEASAMPVLVVDTSRPDVPETVVGIQAFWGIG
jgi:hypothetical protein